MSEAIYDGHKLEFKAETYNGISIIRETATGYVNASRMCSDNNKAWRNFTRTKYWKNKLEAFKRSSFYKVSEGAPIRAPSFYPKNGVKPEFQGEYIHPKLIHFVAEWCDDDYAFKVAELMDSINDQIHEQMKKNNKEDTVEVSKRLFNDLRDTVIKYNMSVHSEEENSKRANTHDVYCWGIRD